MKSNKLLEITEGEYYLFFNFYKSRKQITLGYPYLDSPRNDVYLSVDGEEKGRLSYSESNKYLVDAIKKVLPIYEVKGLSAVKPKTVQSQQIGFCNNCSKKLRGDITKDVCTECWKNQKKSKSKLSRTSSVNNTLRNTITELSSTYNETFQLLMKGCSIQLIADIRERQESTIIKHLLKIHEFVPLSNFMWIRPDQEIMDRVDDAIDNLKDDYGLKDIFDYLEEEVAYDDIRLALVFRK
jgi:uncharacterized protein YpbB